MTKEEILNLFRFLNSMNQWLIRQRQINPLANFVQFPKTPPMLSENLALHLLRDNLILNNQNLRDFRLGGRVADIVGINNNNGNEQTIEIKATVRDFQYFGLNDINSDFLIWLDLSNPIRNNTGIINVYIIPNPILIFERPCKISLNPFLRRTENIKLNFNIDIFDYLIN